jgi:acyl carrier protein
MTDSEIYDTLNKVFRQVLEDDSIVLTPSTTADDVDGWDSMNHIFIVVELARIFNIKFHAAEMEELKNIGELVVIIKEKIAANA